ncbi:hypothetical protein HT102_02570 [Hoyosella sp. G463]|uniref:DUF7455 domain-containing protein n=1 Tax=Lolliginicoccus lacisalsi TaxID=2742202 RepID=A0A927PLG9_9ACTN|nr:hypothetical protein [Lolliginicoccus lacisalsi]MBD8505372.1 hypothetical protein [Lolliginicoccus lacisalsi]
MTAPATTVRLTATDRCDRCGARARVLATLPSGGELLFCQHHANEFEARLKDMDALVVAAADES